MMASGVPSPRPVNHAKRLTTDVACDLCGYAMPIPRVSIDAGAILGLLVCSACVEDQLAARTLLEEHHAAL